jgi:hypothetical protein
MQEGLMRVAVAIGMAAVLILPASAYAAQRQAPYANLFTGQLNVTPLQRPAPAPAPQAVPFPQKPQNALQARTVVCGLTVLQGDSKIDPKMPRQPPTNAPKPSITIVPAQACQTK